MATLIHSNFKIDLTNYNLAITEENFWFSDRFLAKYVLPLNIVLDDELNAALGDLISYDSNNAETYIECKIYLHGKEKDAILEVEELEGRNARVNIRYGIEELPNSNKKLKQLPLEYIDLGATTIYDHAETIYTQTYPAVNYNFVMVHTDKFDTSQDQWIHFQKIINKRVAGDFIENEYDAVEDEQVNRNIMQPQPYLLHVLKKGFEDIGLTLQGDILEDVHIKKTILSEISDYYSKITTQSQELSFNQTEFDSEETIEYGNYFFPITDYYGVYEQEITLPEHGRYKIAGNLNLRKRRNSTVFIKIEFNGDTIYVKTRTSFIWSGEFFFQVDRNIDFTSGSGVVKVTSYQLSRFTDDTSENLEDYKIADLTITQLAKFDGSGNPIATLLAPSEIKLTECVPDMTFGECITAVTNLKLFDLDISDGFATMNYIATQLIPENIVDLSEFEIENPIRIFNKGNTFELKFKVENTEEYTFEKLFITESGYLSNDYTKNDDTEEITINAIPLPITTRDEIKTAHHFIDDKSTLKLILYDGTGVITNIAESNDDILIGAIYARDYENWLNTRIFGNGLKWSFICTEEKLSEFNIKSKVRAYEQNHIIKQINKDLIARGYWNLEIELLTLFD